MSSSAGRRLLRSLSERSTSVEMPAMNTSAMLLMPMANMMVRFELGLTILRVSAVGDFAVAWAGLAVAGRVASIRRVASARVQRQYPSTLRITVVERIQVVVKDYPDGVHLFDEDGVDFATGPPPPGVPYLDTENPGPNDPATKAALKVMTSLRPEVAGQVGRISAPSVASITLTLVDGRTVVWGTTDRTEEKALKLAALLTQRKST